MKSTATTANSQLAEHADFPFTRGARIGLLVLLLITVFFAAGVLFAKYQLESFRIQVEQGLETRFGAHLSMGEVSVNGLWGIRIDDLEVDIPIDSGPMIILSAPKAIIDINLNQIFYGNVSIDRIVMDGSRIEIERSEDEPWYSAESAGLDETIPFDLEEGVPFRITGSDCVLDVRNIVGDTRLTVESFRFDVGRLTGAQDLTANFQGFLSGDKNKRVAVKLNFASLDDFDARIQTDLITAEDFNVVAPSPQHLVAAGTAHPTLKVSGLPGDTLMVTLQTPFEEIELRDHPEFLDPLTGTLVVVATYATDSHLLTVSSAKATSEQLGGEVAGTVQFDRDYPEFDLTLDVTDIPVEDMLSYFLNEDVEQYGDVDLRLEEPTEITVNLKGSSDQPVVFAQATAGSGTFDFVPTEEDQPPVHLVLGVIEGTWDSETQDVTASLTVLNGNIFHDPTGIEAENVSGTFVFANDSVTMNPFNASIAGNACVGEFLYDITTGDGTVKLEGTLANIEDTELASAMEPNALSGAVKIKGEATKLGDRYAFDFEFDATQTEIGFQWWFNKPPGIGASGRVKGDISRDNLSTVEVEGEIASSEILASLIIDRGANGQGDWEVQSITASSDRLDVNAVAKCVPIPYRITGGTGSAGSYEFIRDAEDSNRIYQTIACAVDEITLVADAEDARPMTAIGVTLDLKLETILDGTAPSSGDLTLSMQDTIMPAFGGTWFVPMDTPEGWLDREMNWTYALASKTLELPPWKGTDFNGTAYTNLTQSGLSSYAVNVDGGRLEGNYHSIRADNEYVTEVSWNDVPAHYFMDHLNYPKVLMGSITGEVKYSLDRDDPGTLSGEGFFEISDGQFSADFLYSILQGQGEDQLATLPPNLEFAHLRSEVIFDKDLVRTPSFNLNAKSLKMTGNGHFYRDGDMDYELKVAVDPEAAESVQELAQNFTLEGYRLSNKDLELDFRITGPTFQPRGELAGLPPAHVTLGVGALSLGREAIRAIDLPRKMLIGIFKIGGGVVGSGTVD